MSTFSKGISMFLLSIVIMALLITTALAFMLGFSHPLPWALILLLAIIPFIHEKLLARQYLRWTNSMNTGIELIDNDHKKLLELINQLQKATQYTVDVNSINQIMNDLVSYTKYHFDREEYLMRTNKYPGYIEHKKLHEAMINKMTSCLDQYKNTPDQSIDAALTFLKKWLIKHIKGNDKEYIPYLKNIDLSGHDHSI